MPTGNQRPMNWFYVAMGLFIFVQVGFSVLIEGRRFGPLRWVVLAIGIICLVYGLVGLRRSYKQ